MKLVELLITAHSCNELRHANEYINTDTLTRLFLEQGINARHFKLQEYATHPPPTPLLFFLSLSRSSYIFILSSFFHLQLPIIQSVIKWIVATLLCCLFEFQLKAVKDGLSLVDQR